MAEQSIRRKKDGSANRGNFGSAIRTTGDGRITIFAVGSSLARAGVGCILQNLVSRVPVCVPILSAYSQGVWRQEVHYAWHFAE